MLTISQAQMETLSNQRHDRYVDALYHHCCDKYPSKVTMLGEEQLANFISSTLGEARNFGFESAKHLTLYTTMTLKVFPSSLVKLQWSNDILNNSQLNIDSKMAALQSRVDLMANDSEAKHV